MSALLLDALTGVPGPCAGEGLPGLVVPDADGVLDEDLQPYLFAAGRTSVRAAVPATSGQSA